ncbi:MAG: metal ABC transporter permease, partial [Gammaproteobacteria bacterium]|nr:metal ABC transporter permease [Gammaproteobacteria bacterium]
LLLRRMSLTGDAMAHAILPGAAIGFLIAGLSVQAMTLGGAVAGLAVAVASSFVARSTVLREDASLAAFYLISLALGVLIVSMRGSNVDLMHVLFGSVLALNDAALLLLAGVATLTLVVLAVLYRALVLECLDPSFLRSVSRLSPVAHHTFMVLVVANLVAGFQALGTLLSVGMMVLPAASARFWCRSIGTIIALASFIGLLSCCAGLLLSYHAGLPTGPSIILSAGVFYLFSVLFGHEGVITPLLRSRRHLEA